MPKITIGRVEDHFSIRDVFVQPGKDETTYVASIRRLHVRVRLENNHGRAEIDFSADEFKQIIDEFNRQVQ